jgi:hypothetical protein
MATDRGKQILLGALFVVLAVLGYRALAAWTSSKASSTSNPSRAAAAPQRSAGGGGITAPDVHLDALNGERPKPVAAERNLFRFKPKSAPPPVPAPAAGGRGAAPAGVAPPVQTGPPPLPPISLKFIGRVEREGKPTIAILSDGQGPPLYGVEGGTVAGRYRILKIGVESIEMAYLDGRGRQTIRLTGS